MVTITRARAAEVDGYLTEIDGIECYRIDGVEHMDPFLMSVVSSSDLWMFASSRSTLTAGRADADHAFLPYETDDRIHRAVGISGPTTTVARVVDGRRDVWQPFGRVGSSECRRSVAKSLLGNRLVFEETNDAWQIRFRATWMPSPTFGWIREVELFDLSEAGADLEVLDGLLDVMPPGVEAGLEQIRSNLVDAYKRSETGQWGSAALYTLESLITDRAEPAEALTATLIWSYGQPHFQVSLDERVIEAMIDDSSFSNQQLLTGRRGAYLLRGAVRLQPGAAAAWTMAVDIGLSQADVVDRLVLAGAPDAAERVAEDAAFGSNRLATLLQRADGNQRTGDQIADAHHLSNVMFNVMRGGLFPHGQNIPMSGFLDHVERWNAEVHGRFAPELQDTHDSVDVEQLRRMALDIGDPHLLRLALEYLPLAFSRRHGDPSRPWNRFSINVRGENGEELLGYEGNWRDIFQNWEALLLSYPSFIAGVVAKFVNASTVDGHNPYRITHEGVDWEVPDPHDPWANIGYWGDHQIVYLHRLVAMWERVAPGEIGSWLNRPVFVYANVPYIIAGHAEMIEDPRNTIAFDEAREAEIEDRVARIGSDGRLVTDASGEIVRVGLLEKLVVPVLAKLTALVPGGGIWMNTQRPEWNDANNALAGYGLSMVTLYHLFGYITWLRDLVSAELADGASFSASTGGWLSHLTDVLENFGDSCHTDERQRREMMDALGVIGDTFRSGAQGGFDTSSTNITAGDIHRLLSAALRHLQCAIDASQRPDGLFDSYNVVGFPSAAEASVGRLGPMLEGQVAALSAGFLDAAQSLAVIDSLFASEMYRADQDSFMLYPVVDIPAFTDRNIVPTDSSIDQTTLDVLVESAEILESDRGGELHFAPQMVNSAAVQAAMHETELSASERERVLALYESTFQHHLYTGRSGSMYGYEGIGSIYWHMVGKLLVAIQEAYWRAIDSNEPIDAMDGLAAAYRRVRAGLGFCKSPVEYGAIPTDAYSHTPSHAGAQQPGMTGHVKELVITRFGELGIRTVGGGISLSPGLLERDQVLDLEDGRADFTYCGVAFRITAGEHEQVAVRRLGEWGDPEPGLNLSVADSSEIMGRTGVIEAVEFTLGATR